MYQSHILFRSDRRSERITDQSRILLSVLVTTGHAQSTARVSLKDDGIDKGSIINLNWAGDHYPVVHRRARRTAK